MKTQELKHLFNWCDHARSNDEFWQRFVLASTRYDTRTQAAMLDFVKLANGHTTKPEGGPKKR